MIVAAVPEDMFRCGSLKKYDCFRAVNDYVYVFVFEISLCALEIVQLLPVGS